MVAYIIKELYRVYLDKKYAETFDNKLISQVNKGELGKLHMQYKRWIQKPFNITFS
jgi:hypothetical protein